MSYLPIISYILLIPKKKHVELKSFDENCFREVLTRNIKTIEFCCIALCVFNFPQKKAAKIALSVKPEWLQVIYKSVGCVIFCFYDDPNGQKKIGNFDIYKDRMSAYFPKDYADGCTYVDDNSPYASNDRTYE